MKTRILAASVGFTLTLCGQTAAPQPKPVAPPRAAAAPKAAPMNPQVVEVLEMVKDGINESMIVRKLQIANKPVNPTSAELKAMQSAGVSERIVETLMAPGAVATSAPAASKEVSPAASSAPTPPAAAALAPVAARSASEYNTDLNGLNCVQEPRKRSVAVSEFDYGAIKTALQATFKTDANIGKGIMALVQKRLQQDGGFRIVERANLATLTAEQQAGTSSGVKQGTNPKLGKLIGADAYLMGTIVTFGNDDKQKKVGGGGFIPGVPGLGAVSFKSTTNKAVVAISARLVDTETGELIATMESRGESERKGKGLDFAGMLGGVGAGAGGFDMTSSNFAETLIGEATIKCIDDLAAKMIAQRTKIKGRRIEAEGRIAEISAKSLYINVGDNDGVKKCDRFEVARILQEIRDPQTKEVLGLELEPIGEMVVTEVRPAVAIGVFSGSAPPEKNMSVRKTLPPDVDPAPAAEVKQASAK